jgi:hypothetical protein
MATPWGLRLGGHSLPFSSRKQPTKESGEKKDPRYAEVLSESLKQEKQGCMNVSWSSITRLPNRTFSFAKTPISLPHQ